MWFVLVHMYILKIISMHFTQHYNYNALPDYQSAITIHRLIVFKRIQFHSGARNVPIALRTESVWIFPQMQTEAKNSKSIHTNPLLNYVSTIQQSKTDARTMCQCTKSRQGRKIFKNYEKATRREITYSKNSICRSASEARRALKTKMNFNRIFFSFKDN